MKILMSLNAAVNDFGLLTWNKMVDKYDRFSFRDWMLEVGT
jgi:hypothetical protein